jgi:ATP-binding cassette, subfamily B, bacterial
MRHAAHESRLGDSRGGAHLRAKNPTLDLIGRGGRWVWVLAGVSLCLAIAHTVLPAVLGRAVDAAVRGGRADTWLVWCGLLVAAVVILEAVGDFAAGASTALATASLRHALVRHVLAMGTRATRTFSSGEIVARLVGNAGEAGRLPTAAVWAVTSLLPGVGGIVALAFIDPWLCLTFAAGAPLLIGVIRVCARDASELARRYLEVQSRIAGRLTDALAGARSIAAARTADREVRRVLLPLPELHEHGMGMWRVQTRAAAQEAVLVPLLEVAVLAVAGYELTRGRVTPGELLAAVQYTALASSVGTAVSSVARLAWIRASAVRTDQVLDEPTISYGSAPLPAGSGRVEFRGVSVRVGDVAALDRIDLVIPGGAMVAVVGRSGGGKSLLAALAGRLVDPDDGEICLDGVPLTQVRHADLRSAVGYAFERPVLIGATIGDAIAFGERVSSPDAVRAAAAAARADAFILRMPQGYRTKIDDAPMSGGELQRVALARAFARADRLLILDDVAASLDTVTEHHISEVLTGALSNRTRLIVAHRASTAARADVVVWLDGSRVRAMAPHRELWDCPEYRALFDAQLDGTGGRASSRTACPRRPRGVVARRGRPAVPVRATCRRRARQRLPGRPAGDRLRLVGRHGPDGSGRSGRHPAGLPSARGHRGTVPRRTRAVGGARRCGGVDAVRQGL